MSILDPTDAFPHRHLGPRPADVESMLEALGLPSLEALVAAAVPAAIRQARPLDLPPALGEMETLLELRRIASANRISRSYLGMGYHGTITPGVILRNILENPGWYTAYTPYQAEIAQGRLEMLFNFQTMTADLTGLPVSGASLLDEATAAAEAMSLALRSRPRDSEANVFFVDGRCHPQTVAVVRTRADAIGVEVVVGEAEAYDFARATFGCLIQYPTTEGVVLDHEAFCARAHERGATVAVATDLLALALLRPPGEFGADVAIGNSQRFGVQMGFGGPHAAFLCAREEFRRQLPGRIIGLSTDADGQPALRMALQTREQHIRRDRATSNICTAQVLLAVVAGAYAVYHGPEGIRTIARRVAGRTRALADVLAAAGHAVGDGPFFDTLTVTPTGRSVDEILAAAAARAIDLRRLDDRIAISLDETVGAADLEDLAEVFGAPRSSVAEAAARVEVAFDAPHARTSDFMSHPVFGRYRSETEMLRYLHRLQVKDLTLDTSMIALGSCTMKLNATSQMLPVTWPEFGLLHPFAPPERTAGYRRLFDDLEAWLAEITGFAAISLQPNAGSQGEYAGLLVIRKYLAENGGAGRDVCLIPTSAHGTNPASAVMAGLRVVAVACDAAGNVDLADLESKAARHADRLAALMITYPSTHGVFEEGIRRITEIVHEHGGQVYLDGANLNAQVGLARPGDYGADVCHLNLHKTFCIPHGGGGPGMGPIGVAAHLAPYLPGHPVVATGGPRSLGTISAAPWGSPAILPISWVYIRSMGAAGLTEASRIAILSANYVAHRLEGHYPVLYRGSQGRVAHECIVDLRPLKKTSGVEADDVAKRLMDYGFHAPTVSFPVAGTLMIEPTESESKEELDRFCEAMISIRNEIRAIEEGRIDRADNPLKNAPHTARMVMADEWDHPYSRREAATPAPWQGEHKYWPPVRRIDNVSGDRNLICTCPSVEELAEVAS